MQTFREWLRENELNEADYSYIIYPKEKKYYILTKQNLMSRGGGQIDNNELLNWKVLNGIKTGIISANPSSIRGYKEISFDDVKKLELSQPKQNDDDDIHSYKHSMHKNR